ncbi:MAG: hypothetical protein ABGX16_08545, partial [Pirellulales bacterium]
MLILPSDADPVEEYAAAEMAAHVKQVTMIEPQIVHATDSEIQRACAGEANLLVLGRVKNNMLLRRLAKVKFFKANSNDQGYTLRTATNIFDKTNRTWLAVLCGKDPRGVLYAVRDFMHFHFYRTNTGPRLEYFRFSHAPTIKVRYLSESGCNLFSAENDDPDFMRKPSRNGYSHNVVFDKQYYLDWLSHCKITHLNMVWCNATAYDRAWNQMVAYARSRGIQVWRHYVPYRPQHEYPPEHISSVPPSSSEGDCPRDRETQTWYLNRLKQMVMQKPLIAGIVIESPYHDSVYCHCEQCRGKENPYSEKLMLEEFVTLARGLRPDLQIIRVTKNPISDQDTAVRIAEELQGISEKVDFNINTFVDRKHRIRWHDLGYEYGTYLRTYRSALKGKNVEKEVNFLYQDFQSSVNRGVIV